MFKSLRLEYFTLISQLFSRRRPKHTSKTIISEATEATTEPTVMRQGASAGAEENDQPPERQVDMADGPNRQWYIFRDGIRINNGPFAALGLPQEIIGNDNHGHVFQQQWQGLNQEVPEQSNQADEDDFLTLNQSQVTADESENEDPQGPRYLLDCIGDYQGIEMEEWDQINFQLMLEEEDSDEELWDQEMDGDDDDDVND